MGKRHVYNGQTLVELALVLPCFCLGVFMAVQLICYCHNMIELQRMAQVMMDRVTYDNYRARKNYTRFHSLWGRYASPQSRFSSESIPHWRPFRGVSTVHEPGRFFTVHVRSELWPGRGFRSALSSVSQSAYAENFLEPPLPLED